jgi:hypothetical protein
MREHGHIGIHGSIDLPMSGKQESRRGGRPSRRGAIGPRPVRPPVLQVSPRPDTVPAIRRPEPYIGGVEPCDGARGRKSARAGVVRAATVDGVAEVDEACVRAGRRRGAASVAYRGGHTRPSAAGPRLLARRPGMAQRRGDRVRRVMAGLALALAAAAVVVGLGHVADLTAHARGAGAPAVAQAAEVTVKVAAPSTVWDVADRVRPGLSGPERAALVDRIVAANSLTSLRVRSGEVLRVPL